MRKRAEKKRLKKAKVSPVVAKMDKNTRKMAKMMKKMTLAKKSKRVADSSSSDEEDSQHGDMEVDTQPAVTKLIHKKKPLPRSYYQALKKNLRRKVKSGMMPDIAKLDKLLAGSQQ